MALQRSGILRAKLDSAKGLETGNRNRLLGARLSPVVIFETSFGGIPMPQHSFSRFITCSFRSLLGRRSCGLGRVFARARFSGPAEPGKPKAEATHMAERSGFAGTSSATK